MNAIAIVWLLTCVAGGILSIASAAVLRGRSAWTIAGWIATLAYFAIAAIDLARARPAYAHIDYVALGALTACFTVAGFRDEPQAEPWWWPRRSGLTGAERRARTR